MTSRWDVPGGPLRRRVPGLLPARPRRRGHQPRYDRHRDESHGRRIASRLDLPLPFGPTSATNVPGAQVSEASRRICVPLGRPRDITNFEPHRVQSMRLRARMSQRKNGAPANAVTMPIGSSSRSHYHAGEDVRPGQEDRSGESGRRQETPVVGAHGEPDDMRHHQTHETNAAAQRDEHSRGQRGDDESEPSQPVTFDAERGGRLLAKTEDVQRSRMSDQQHPFRQERSPQGGQATPIGRHQDRRASRTARSWPVLRWVL